MVWRQECVISEFDATRHSGLDRDQSYQINGVFHPWVSGHDAASHVPPIDEKDQLVTDRNNWLSSLRNNERAIIRHGETAKRRSRRLFAWRQKCSGT